MTNSTNRTKGQLNDISHRKNIIAMLKKIDQHSESVQQGMKDMMDAKNQEIKHKGRTWTNAYSRGGNLQSSVASNNDSKTANLKRSISGSSLNNNKRGI